jgi:hypothetical protein
MFLAQLRHGFHPGIPAQLARPADGFEAFGFDGMLQNLFGRASVC